MWDATRSAVISGGDATRSVVAEACMRARMALNFHELLRNLSLERSCRQHGRHPCSHGRRCLCRVLRSRPRHCRNRGPRLLRHLRHSFVVFVGFFLVSAFTSSPSSPSPLQLVVELVFGRRHRRGRHFRNLVTCPSLPFQLEAPHPRCHRHVTRRIQKQPR